MENNKLKGPVKKWAIMWHLLLKAFICPAFAVNGFQIKLSSFSRAAGADDVGGQEFLGPLGFPCWEAKLLLVLYQKSACIFIWKKVGVWDGVTAEPAFLQGERAGVCSAAHG